MEPESQVLIDEVVLTDTGVNWQMAQMDLIMMASFGAKERTKENWRVVCDAAGLEIKDVVTYAYANRNSVIIAVKR
jgi:demethylsterigmatocystin 6-O-methyltransferase